MLVDALTHRLFTEVCRIPLIDPHSHIDPHSPTSRSLDDILGYHYYTELAHSAGMSQAPLASKVPPRDRVRALLSHLDRIDNTVQYRWFLDIARTFLGFSGDRPGPADTDALCDAAERTFGQPGWEDQVFARSNLERIFLTNEFDDPLEGFDTRRYVPCLRTDALVFQLALPEVRQRLARAAGVEPGDPGKLRHALDALFVHFLRHGGRACAISLPPDFTPHPVSKTALGLALVSPAPEAPERRVLSHGTFWMLAELCRDHGLPFALMIGVNRRVYPGGVCQGQDLFDQRTSLIQFAELFNAFPTVPFCVSVLSSPHNHELASYSWIFPNVVTSGHWWYSNVPVHIEHDLRARLQAVPKTKQIGYYSDAYKLEFVLPKYNTYRAVLARVLADDFVRPGLATETQALALARLLLRDNVQRLFAVQDT